MRSHYLAKKRVNDQFIFEERSLARILRLTDLLPSEQLPAKKIVEMLAVVQKKRQSLCQLVVCKFAVNSLDTHYILAKAQELSELI